MSWFSRLTGIAQETPNSVRDHLSIEDGFLTSDLTDLRARIGTLTTPNLAELRQRPLRGESQLRLVEFVGDVRELHTYPGNAGAFFQVASQFNLLEMVSPRVCPEAGLAIYEHDLTQGPACAIACGAGTIYRNYFVPLQGQLGQSADRQIDCLSGIHTALDNASNGYWTMRNGYALPSEDGLQRLNRVLKALSSAEKEALKEQLQIGVQTDTEVTFGDNNHTVTQAYCSALPVSYSNQPADDWEAFARLILDASYEACLRAAAWNAERTGNPRVYLTLLGGGAFGNRSDWISDALLAALEIIRDCDLDIRLVSYGEPSWTVAQIIDRWNTSSR